MKTPLNITCYAALLSLLLIVGAVTSAACAADVSNPRANGPLELVIMVHTKPDQRVALRRVMESTGLQDYARWKREGILSSYQVLFNRYVDNENWDLMTVLKFADQTGISRWKKIEQGQPAGLPAAALALVSTIETAPSDEMNFGKASNPAKQGESVFVVLPYNYFVSTDEYIKYADDYIIPQTDGWVKAGLLASYQLILNRYPSGRYWSSLLILEYRNDDALGHRDEVMAKVRAELANNPKWKAISERKQHVREGREYVIADEL